MMIMPNNASSTPPGSSQTNNFSSTSSENLPPHANLQNSTSLNFMANNAWIITLQEHQSNECQFVVLRPTNGMIGGEQARPFFLKSGLPATILAQIWQLADLNKDGKLDKFEFSIAMKLVRNCLTGLPLPPVLPDSMRQICGATSPLSIAQSSSTFVKTQTPINAPLANQYYPQMSPRPMSTYGTMPTISSSYRPPIYRDGSQSAVQTPSGTGSATLPFQMGTRELGDWTLPQQSKLRFCQHFNQLDRSRIGLLTGQQARGVLGESQLPTQVLAQIWNMSDVNKDGCLSIEEFCTAQYLIEMIKAGYALPLKLPHELYAFCHRSRTVSPSSVSAPMDPNIPPPQKIHGVGGTGQLKTFEDKRRDNLDRGQAELDRRRQILREEEERRRADIERREREETERRERERQELERRREAELEAEWQKELQRERERAAEEERQKIQREETRRRLESERIQELEKIRIRDLENQFQAETEKTTQIQQRHRTMAFQLQALDERAQQLNNDITGSRDKILEITKEIEGMREQRDEKCSRIQLLEKKIKELNIQSERFSHENLQLQSECQRQLSRSHQIEVLRKELDDFDYQIQHVNVKADNIAERAANQEKLVKEKHPSWMCANELFKRVEQEHKELIAKYHKVRQQIHPAVVFSLMQTSPTSQYEMPPSASEEDTIFCTTPKTKSKQNDKTDNGFENDFAAFDKASVSTAIQQIQKQSSMDQIERRRKSDSGSIGTVASIAAKLQQQISQQSQQTLFNQEVSIGNSNADPKTNTIADITTNSSQDSLKQQQIATLPATAATTPLKTFKYKALYEFNARSGDELSLQPGDMILVFEGHQSEPGWLAGQIRDKVGWFPAAFAEPISSATASPVGVAPKKAGSLTGSPSSEPLASIKEEGEPTMTTEKQQSFIADFQSAFSKSVSLTDTSKAGQPIITQQSTTMKTSHSSSAFANSGGALYDLPPSNNEQKPVAVTKIELEKTNTNPLYEIPPDASIVNSSTMETKENITLLGTGIALYQWKARNDQEMSFARGDIIEVLEHGEMRWRGRLQKNRQIQGWFPKSYIKLDAVANASVPTNNGITNAIIKTPQQNKLNKSLSSNGSTEIAATNQSLLANVSNQLDIKKQTNLINEMKGGEWFIALYQFDAVEPTDLSLKPGDRIWVTDQNDQWWRGQCQGKEGIFPANYVQHTSETINIPQETNSSNDVNGGQKQVIGRAIAAFQATASNQISLKPGDIVRVHQQTPGGWWEGELERDNVKKVGWFPGNYIQILSGQDGKLFAIAVFDYQAQHDDELSFKIGDLIEVIECIDAQWWKGRKQSNEKRQQQPLLFPVNFVQLQ